MIGTKIVVLITGGRTGSDFFQSLLDGHPEVMTFPGVFYFDSFWESLIPTDTATMIADKFCRAYPHFFDSRLNLQERHHMLGANRDDCFQVDQASFHDALDHSMKDKPLSKYNVLTCLHTAYSSTSKHDGFDKKLILLHLHHVRRLKVVADMDVDVLYTLRDPLVNLQSAVKHWLLYDKSKFNSWSLMFYIDRLVNGLADVVKYGKQTFVIQLENLHLRHREVMAEFCRIYDIAFHPCMNHSTYHGKLWWGDALSGRFLNGVNPDFKNSLGLNDYFKRDVALLEEALWLQLQAYGYPRRSEIRGSTRWLCFMPLKYEWKLWMLAVPRFSWKEIVRIPEFWIRRILALRRACSRRISWPHSIGSNKRSHLELRGVSG